MSEVADRRRRGFTLVEVVVVLAIAGMLTVAAVPMFRNVGARSSRSVLNTAQTLRQYLRSARTYAIQNRVKAALCYVQMKRWDGEELELAGQPDKWTGYVLVYEDPRGMWHRFRGGPLTQRIAVDNPLYMRGGRMVKVVTATSSEEEPILSAFKEIELGVDPDVPRVAVKGYSAFRPSGMGTMHVGGKWRLLAGRSVVYVYDDRVADEGHMSVNIVNSTGAVKVRSERPAA